MEQKQIGMPEAIRDGLERAQMDQIIVNRHIKESSAEERFLPSARDMAAGHGFCPALQTFYDGSPYNTNRGHWRRPAQMLLPIQLDS